MTVSSQTAKVSYAGNGSTKTFAVNFYFLADGDLRISKRAANGTETTLVLTTNYTVSGAGNPSGGSITLTSGTAAPATGETITISRNVPLTQETDYQANDDFPAESHERALDKLTMEVQQLNEVLGRSLKLSVTNTINSTEFTVGPADRVNKVLGFDANGELVVSQELGTYRGNWSVGTAYSQRDIIKDTSNANVYICLVAHTSSGSQPISTNADAAKWALLVDAASAKASQDAAAASATAAASSASAASTSATNSANSASASAASATNSANSATAAASSASAADASKTAAAGSATSAAGSASTATTKASEASSSASAAASSATSASSSASSASTSKTAAETAATNSAASAALANDWATKTAGPVAGGEYSAKYHAQQAASSASSASSSASTATTKASEAASSAASAAASKNDAQAIADYVASIASYKLPILLRAGASTVVQILGSTVPVTNRAGGVVNVALSS